MNGVDEEIRAAEIKLTGVLDNYVQGCFEGVWLPSHDLKHHQRVWFWAKSLLVALAQKGVEFSNEYVEGLMIAAYFHDVGMVKTLAPEHGRVSAQFAEEFVARCLSEEPVCLSEIIRAIELHDRKEYLDAELDLHSPSIYTLLTVADDLDAFGALGFYRYLEIYLMRKMDVELIIDAIERNIVVRFGFVSKLLCADESLQRIHTARYKRALHYLNTIGLSDLQKIKAIINAKEDILHAELYGGAKSLGIDMLSELELFCE